MRVIQIRCVWGTSIDQIPADSVGISRWVFCLSVFPSVCSFLYILWPNYVCFFIIQSYLPSWFCRGFFMKPFIVCWEHPSNHIISFWNFESIFLTIMAFVVEEGYFNIDLTFGEGNSHDSEWLEQLKLGLDNFFEH